jgi:predicted thioesterase
LPLLLEWSDPPVPPRMTSTVNRLYYADYRDVSGLKLPFRIRRAIGTMTIEETTFDRFLVNAKIDPKKFEKGFREIAK